MKTLARYLEVIVDPSFDDFHSNSSSVRHAYLACVAIFHAVDRAAAEKGTSSASIRQVWCKESLQFKLVDMVAHHLKHVQCSDEKTPSTHSGIPIAHVLGFDEADEGMDLRNLHDEIRDAVRFVHKKAGTTTPNCLRLKASLLLLSFDVPNECGQDCVVRMHLGSQRRFFDSRCIVQMRLGGEPPALHRLHWRLSDGGLPAHADWA